MYVTFSLLLVGFFFHSTLGIEYVLSPEALLVRELSGQNANKKASMVGNNTSPTIIPGVSAKCESALKEVMSGKYLNSYIDAAGKPQSGVSKGNVAWLGAYKMCQTIPDAQYCLAQVTVLQKLPISWGMCIPKACDGNDIKHGLKDIVIGLDFDIDLIFKTNATVGLVVGDVNCARPSEYTAGAILTLILCGLIALFCVIGTLLEIVQNHSLYLPDVNIASKYGSHGSNGVVNSTEPDAESDSAPLLDSRNDVPVLLSVGSGSLGQFFLCFSLIRNSKAVLDTRVKSGSITSVHGTRVLSMWWVILGHTYLWLLLTGVLKYPLVTLQMVHNFSFQAVNNAFFAVDSFFLLSGLLVSYLALRRMDENGGRLNLFQFYFHRLWRLTPCYMFVILFYAKLMPYLGEGPRWYASQIPTPCEKYWWTNLLYINNFYPDQLISECLGWSWYLANDMQFYVISPILLYIMYRFRDLGLFFGVGGLLAASFVVTASIIGVFDLNVALAGAIEGNQMRQQTKAHNYSDAVYIKPYCRISPYLVGLALGYILHTQRKSNPRMRLYELVIGWTVAILCGMSTVYGIYTVYRVGGRPFNKAENIIYGTSSRFVWGLSLAWVIYVCHRGYGSLMNSLLSARFWIPLSRLTYSAYLLHPIVLGAIFGSFQHTVAYTTQLFVYYFVGTIVVSYTFAYVLAVCVEYPTMNLEKLLIKLTSFVRSFVA